MRKIYYAGSCPLCGNYGDMEIMCYPASGSLSVVCEECMLEFETPNDYARCINGYRHSGVKAQSRPASIDEIAATGWYVFVKSCKRNFTEGECP